MSDVYVLLVQIVGVHEYPVVWGVFSSSESASNVGQELNLTAPFEVLYKVQFFKVRDD